MDLTKPICRCSNCKKGIFFGDWDFDESERVPVCPDCKTEIDLPEGM